MHDAVSMRMPDKHDPIADAEALVKAGEPGRAVMLLRKVLASGKGGILTRIALSRALLAAGELESALVAARETWALAPGVSDAALVLGEVLLTCGHLPTAISEFQRAVELAPASDAARLALGSAWLEAGEAERASQILADIPSTSYFARPAAAKIAAADEMKRANRSAPGYVRHLFDQFAPDYDRRMLEDLSYRAPHILRGLADMLGIAEAGTLSVLDLGCGTGLSGAVFKDIAARLDGVDLSPKMIAAARSRAIYDGLTVQDIETSLAQDGPAYDLIVAADTLVYLGDLSPVLSGARVRLKEGRAVVTDNGQQILDVTGLRIADPLGFESEVNQWPGVVTVGVFAHQKAAVCLLGTASGVKTLAF